MNLHAPQNFKLKRALTVEDIDQYERYMHARARESFYCYRQLMNPGLQVGWFQQHVAQHLQQFYEDWKAKKKPILVLEAPPQHGKSTQVTDFIAWASGHSNQIKTIYASYSDDLGLVCNARLQRAFGSPLYNKIFPQMGEMWGSDNTKNLTRNSSHIEFSAGGGEFRNTTINGQITGMGLELGVIDDPIKGRKEAQSKTIRDGTWFWFTDDFFSRFSETAAMLMIMTRWHVDDPVGRFLEQYPDAKVLKFPALGKFDKKGKWVADDSKSGKALFPEWKSAEFLRKRKKVLSIGSWASLYQQSPIVVGGGVFPVDMFEIVKQVPRKDVRKSVRYWDKAGTQDGGAYTSGCLMHWMADGRILIESVIRGQWKAVIREKYIKETAASDSAFCNDYTVWVEQEPGSGGKESAENTVRMLVGYNVFPDKVTGDKEFRAEPYSAQVQGGNVMLLAGAWNQPFKDEHEEWPSGKYKDQVDSAAGAFMKLVGGSTYDTTLSWVG